MLKKLSECVLFLRTSELKKKLFYTAAYLALFRLGTYIVLPGIDASFVVSGKNGLLGILDSFVGGAFSKRSVFSLGIMPYISASIIVHMMTLLFPTFQKIKSEGQAGMSRINKITKLLTLLIAVIQSFAFFSADIAPKELLLDSKIKFLIISAFVLTGGSMVCVWIGERISDYGIGQGISLLILVGVVSSLPGAIYSEYILKEGSFITLFLEALTLLTVVIFVIKISLAVRKIRLNYANENTTIEEVSADRDHFPIKFIMAGVMPIIFGNVIIMFIAFLSNLLSNKSVLAMNIYSSLKDPLSLTYNLTFSILIVIFTYLYTAINVNPFKISDNFRSDNYYIPLIKPGKDTAEKIDNILNLITLPASLSLVIVALLPFIANYFGIGGSMSYFFGGTSMLIAIPVAVECIKQIETHWLAFILDKSKYQST